MGAAPAIIPIRVPFHEDEIFCDAGGGVVAMNPTCEAMGLSFGSQYNRLMRARWAKSTVFMMKMVAADGKEREMTFVPRKVFALWLATIDTNRIKDKVVREKVERYQLEAADALDRHFFGAPAAPAVQQPPEGTDPLEAVLMVALETRRRQLEAERRVDAVDAKAEGAAKLAGSAYYIARSARETADYAAKVAGRRPLRAEVRARLDAILDRPDSVNMSNGQIAEEAGCVEGTVRNRKRERAKAAREAREAASEDWKA